MELLQLRYFLTVAEMLNISHAAKHHMIPQPAMSKTISRLEKELGTPLFDRYKNKLSLTAEGETFYRSVSQSLSSIDSTAQSINRIDAPLSGEVKILVCQHRPTVLDSIVAFKKQYPQVSFRFFYEQDATEACEYDLCIACEQPDKAFNKSVCLITEPLKLVVSAEHPAAKAERIGFDALRQEAFAIISRKSNLWRQAELQCQKVGFTPGVAMTCADLHCLLKFVASGMAVTLGPEVSWRGLRREDVAFVPTQPTLERSTYLFWNELKTPSRVCSIYREFLVEYFRHLPCDD
jgi:DNA-binding transcriptional LysR family regulator